jgi:hypothetical protein
LPTICFIDQRLSTIGCNEFTFIVERVLLVVRFQHHVALDLSTLSPDLPDHVALMTGTSALGFQFMLKETAAFALADVKHLSGG